MLCCVRCVRCVALRCVVLCCVALRCIVLYCIVLHCSVLYCIVVSVLKSILSYSLSASSRRPEDVNMSGLVWYTERGRC